MAYYCSLCRVFSGDSMCAEQHLKSQEHNKKYRVGSQCLIQYSNRQSVCLIRLDLEKYFIFNNYLSTLHTVDVRSERNTVHL